MAGRARFIVGYPETEPARARFRAIFFALPAVAQTRILFAADVLRAKGLEGTDVVANVNETHEVGVIDASYGILVFLTPMHLTVIREVGGARHWITDIGRARPARRFAAQGAAAAIGLVPRFIDRLHGRLT